MKLQTPHRHLLASIDRTGTALRSLLLDLPPKAKRSQHDTVRWRRAMLDAQNTIQIQADALPRMFPNLAPHIAGWGFRFPQTCEHITFSAQGGRSNNGFTFSFSAGGTARWLAVLQTCNTLLTTPHTVPTTQTLHTFLRLDGGFVEQDSLTVLCGQNPHALMVENILKQGHAYEGWMRLLSHEHDEPKATEPESVFQHHTERLHKALVEGQTVRNSTLLQTLKDLHQTPFLRAALSMGKADSTGVLKELNKSLQALGYSPKTLADDRNLTNSVFSTLGLKHSHGIRPKVTEKRINTLEKLAKQWLFVAANLSKPTKPPQNWWVGRRPWSGPDDNTNPFVQENRILESLVSIPGWCQSSAALLYSLDRGLHRSSTECMTQLMAFNPENGDILWPKAMPKI